MIRLNLAHAEVSGLKNGLIKIVQVELNNGAGDCMKSDKLAVPEDLGIVVTGESQKCPGGLLQGDCVFQVREIGTVSCGSFTKEEFGD